ncbi:Coiled-coil domain-containing protein r3hcc1l [Sparganum proliferum]
MQLCNSLSWVISNSWTLVVCWKLFYSGLSLLITLAKSYDNMQPAALDHPYLRFLAGISNRRYYKALFEEVLVKLSELCLSDRFRPDVRCSSASAEPKVGAFVEACMKVPKKRKSTRRRKRKQVDSGRFGHVIEVCDVPLEKGLSLLWLHFTEGGFYAERVTPSCLLAKFSSCAEARRALELLAKEFVKARSMLEASDEAKARILRSPAEWALVFKPRPRTDSSVASRLILSHLSLTDRNDLLPDPPVTTKDRLLQSPLRITAGDQKGQDCLTSPFNKDGLQQAKLCASPRNPPAIAKNTASAAAAPAFSCTSGLFGKSVDLTGSDSGQKPRLDSEVACRFVSFHLGLTAKTSRQREAC